MGVQTSSCVVKGLAFLGAFNEGLGYGSLDFKGRPLLAVLSSEPGRLCKVIFFFSLQAA
jgi:hypothetical protein